MIDLDRAAYLQPQMLGHEIGPVRDVPVERAAYRIHMRQYRDDSRSGRNDRLVRRWKFQAAPACAVGFDEPGDFGQRLDELIEILHLKPGKLDRQGRSDRIGWPIIHFVG